ncbi:hypothetical protein [Flavisphingomonas formosensis]|uniref:hypothetical protein n=1 Tax=Flavisphingomonas formosensis TaxID=861534 RepID=UPI0012F8E358|nr:hypothetical protein [Sphingomonas formosensis]
MSAPSAPVSIREFARLDGCDEKLVRRAVKAGKLLLSGDGKIDPALAGSGWRRQNRRTENGADTASSAKKVSAPAQPVRTKRKASRGATAEDLQEALDAIAGEEVDDFLAKVLRGDFASVVRAEQIKENGLAAKHLIAARKEAGSLVEVERAEAIFFEAARSWRDAWIGFPTRVGPLLAADLDVDTDRVVEALTIHVQHQLEQLGEPQGDFTAQQ